MWHLWHHIPHHLTSTCLFIPLLLRKLLFGRACRPHTCVGFLCTLQLPPTDQKHAHEVDGESKLPHDMSVGVSCGCAPGWKHNCLHFLPLVVTK